mmetsp:Transcript_32016/g.52904  ORF Transcript_32016/g.52904 Transcript_32016/m.52904 type:complete len:94 (+) Transcript_32016:1119-1400(+)
MPQFALEQQPPQLHHQQTSTTKTSTTTINQPIQSINHHDAEQPQPLFHPAAAAGAPTSSVENRIQAAIQNFRTMKDEESRKKQKAVQGLRLVI